jgi:heme-degrading monooxygenase HmoA
MRLPLAGGLSREMATLIARHWRGVAKADRAEAYVEHLLSETFPSLNAIPGFVGASILRRIIPEGVEFLVVTQWTSPEAIQAFAGPRAETAVVPQEVQDMMLEYDRSARHYEVVV